ncbi:MAG: polysaccharide deacetylase family protein [Acutalibacter sp.]|jgi:hypothetical protein
MSLQMHDRLLWPNGKRKAFTVSYDDGVTQDIRLIELLNRYKIKGTFNLNSGLLGQPGMIKIGKKPATHNKVCPEDVKRIYAGHEVASHGLYHTTICNTDAARCLNEILTCRKELEALVEHPLTSFAYAFGAYDDIVLDALKSCGITYARTINATHTFEIPENFLTWHPTCHHDDEMLPQLTEKFLTDTSWFPMLKLFYVWGHSYEFDQNDNWDHIESFLKKMSGHETIWYATNGEIARYVSAYRQLVFSVDGNFVYNPTSITIWVGSIGSEAVTEIKPGCVTALPEPTVL